MQGLQDTLCLDNCGIVYQILDRNCLHLGTVLDDTNGWLRSVFILREEVERFLRLGRWVLTAHSASPDFSRIKTGETMLLSCSL